MKEYSAEMFLAGRNAPVDVGWESGYYIAIEATDEYKGGSRVYNWLCRACGEIYKHTAKYMTSQYPKCCGCLYGRSPANRKVEPYDLLQGTRNSFNAMKNRIRDKSRHNAYLYVGVSFYWKRFKDFLRYLETSGIGLRPSVEYTLDRIDGKGNYEPGNIRWILRDEQNRNQKKNVFLDYYGTKLCAAEFSRKSGIQYKDVLNAAHKGMTGDQVLARYYVQQEMKFAA